MWSRAKDTDLANFIPDDIDTLGRALAESLHRALAESLGRALAESLRRALAELLRRALAESPRRTRSEQRLLRSFFWHAGLSL